MIKINKTQIFRDGENVDKTGAVDFTISTFLNWNNFALWMVWKRFLVETLKNDKKYNFQFCKLFFFTLKFLVNN